MIIVQTLVDDFQFVTNSILNVIEEAAGIPDRVDVKMPHAHRMSSPNAQGLNNIVQSRYSILRLKSNKNFALPWLIMRHDKIRKKSGMKCKFLGRVGTCYTEKNSSTSKIMQMYIALYALVTWQLKLKKTLSVKNLFSNCLWFSYSSTFHMFSIYKTMVHNKSDLAQSIILWSSPGQIFIQGNMIKKWWKQG